MCTMMCTSMPSHNWMAGPRPRTSLHLLIGAAVYNVQAILQKIYHNIHSVCGSCGLCFFAALTEFCKTGTTRQTGLKPYHYPRFLLSMAKEKRSRKYLQRYNSRDVRRRRSGIGERGRGIFNARDTRRSRSAFGKAFPQPHVTARHIVS